MRYIKILSISLLVLINNNVNSNDANCIDNINSKYQEMVFNARDLIKIITLEDYHIPELQDKEYKYNNNYNKLRIHLNFPENKIVFAIRLQEDMSSIHYKVINKLPLNNEETNLYTALKNIVYNKSTDSDAKLLLGKYTSQLNKEQAMDKYKNYQIMYDYAIEYRFYTTFDITENIKKIKLDTKTKGNQLKLDIYKQLQKQAKKFEVFTCKKEDFVSFADQFITKYDQEYNAVYAYFINEKLK